MDVSKSTFRAGLISRLDAGSANYRVGLWRLAFKIFKEWGVSAIYFPAGLVDYRAAQEELKRDLLGCKQADRDAKEKKFLDKIAKELAKLIPSLEGVKIYLTTSAAYDGRIGEEVAYRLAELRRDIYHSLGRERHDIKNVGRTLGIYTPEKNPWQRGDYYDTPGLRVLKDERKRSSHGLADFNVVGGFAVSVFNPGDSVEDVRRPYLLLPALGRIGKVRVAENQVGLKIVEIKTDNLREATVISFNYKDLLADEGRLVRAPRGSSDIQKDIVRVIGEKGARTIGLLEDATHISRDRLAEPLQNLLTKKSDQKWPGLNYNEANRRYGFKRRWFQRYLRHPQPPAAELATDSFVAFACLHAGSKWTKMLWFRDELPKLILQNGIRRLVGVGDFIEGLKHDLLWKGELSDALNYTDQEELAAYLVGSVELAVFKTRFQGWLKDCGAIKLEQEKLITGVEQTLPDFIYRKGNHCCWVEPMGFRALAVFRKDLLSFVTRGVRQALSKANLHLNALDQVVAQKMIEIGDDDNYRLPSGLSISLYHPEMGRTKTPSIRAQQALGFSDAQVVFMGNFHTAEHVQEHDHNKGGQRDCLDLPTLKIRSRFEDGKFKIVTTGVAFYEVERHNGKIWKSRITFRGTEKTDQAQLRAENEQVLQDFYKYRSI